jgi:hypothetical protein
MLLVVHQNDRLSEVIVPEIVDSDHLPVMFTILNAFGVRDALDPVEKLFQSLAYHLIPAGIQIYSSEEADKAACAYVASTECPRRKGQYSGNS